MNTIIGWTSLNTRRNALKRKVVRQRIWKGLNIVVAVTTLLNVSAVGSFLAPKAALAAVGLNLDQWHNDDAQWANGNINSSNSSYTEGDAVPFKLVISGLDSGVSQVVRIRADATSNSGINAYDYLVTYNFSEVPSPIPGGAPITANIPSDPSLGFTQAPGVFSVWGGAFGTITGPVADVHEKYFDVTVIGGGSDVTLLWAGHLASEADWGVGAGSSSISGAPFHMAASKINGSRESGKQDRSIQPGDIIPPAPAPGTLTVIKHVVSGNSTASDFTLTVTNGTPGSFPGSETGTAVSVPANGAYSVSEDFATGYSALYSTDCTGTMSAGGSKTCTVTNTRDTGTVTVNKYFYDNGPGGEPTRTNPEGWTWDIKSGQQNIAGGTKVELATEVYGISEEPISGYSSSWYCSVGDQFIGEGNQTFFNVSIDKDKDVTCAFTNTYNPTAPNLTITKTDNHTTAQLGETLTYQVTVTNSGDLPANGVKVDDTLPSFLSNPTDISDSGVFGAGHIIWSNLSVPGHDSKVVSFKATVNASMPVGTTVLHNIADLGCNFLLLDIAEFQCPWTGTATDDTSVTVNPVVIQSVPNLSITKVNSVVTFANPGTTVTYTVVVKNTGNGTATSVDLTDVLPSGFTFTGGTSTKTFNLGDIAPGVSVTTTYVVGISASQAAGIYTNTATADGTNTSPVSTTSKVEVRVPVVLGVQNPELDITKTVDQGLANPSDVVTYTVTISNSGDGDATNVVVTDELPSGFAYVDGGGATKTWTFAVLKSGEQKVIAYQVSIASTVSAGVYLNRAFVLADGFDPIVAQAAVEVRIPQVLGLATTGVGSLDIATFGFGIIMLALGFIGLRKLRLDPEGEQIKE